MHGLINKTVESFFRLTYGAERWQHVVKAAELEFSEFEAMLIYDDDESERLLKEVCADIGRPRNEVLEDIGTFLVSHRRLEPLRRLLRFGGETYVDFLNSLDDLPDRVRLAVSDLHLPQLELQEHTPGLFCLSCAPDLPGFSNVLVGVLRAMADDYGALVMIDHRRRRDGTELITIALIESAYAEGRSFELGAGTG